MTFGDMQELMPFCITRFKSSATHLAESVRKTQPDISAVKTGIGSSVL